MSRALPKDLFPDLNRKQRELLARAAEHYDLQAILAQQLRKKYPMLTEEEIGWQVADRAAASAPAVALVLWETGQRKWPSLTPDEIIWAIHDGAAAGPDMVRRAVAAGSAPETSAVVGFVQDRLANLALDKAKGFFEDPEGTLEALGEALEVVAAIAAELL